MSEGSVVMRNVDTIWTVNSAWISDIWLVIWANCLTLHCSYFLWQEVIHLILFQMVSAPKSRSRIFLTDQFSWKQFVLIAYNCKGWKYNVPAATFCKQMRSLWISIAISKDLCKYIGVRYERKCYFLSLWCVHWLTSWNKWLKSYMHMCK